MIELVRFQESGMHHQTSGIDGRIRVDQRLAPARVLSQQLAFQGSSRLFTAQPTRATSMAIAFWPPLP